MLVHYMSVGGYAEIPFCQASVVVPREYVFGFFIDEATDLANMEATFAAVRAELLREQIRSALSDWGQCEAEPTPPPAALIGDANCDETLNAIDAAIILQFTASLIGSLPCDENADVNESGDVDAIDAAIILQFSAGLIVSLPP